MSFIESYKHLENICGDMMNDERRLSAYIEEMIKSPNGSYYVKNWDEDLKTLKHYRWIRNQISHEPGCTEENMCEADDAVWLDNFYERIMKQSDPLAQYYRAVKQTNNPQKHGQAHNVSKNDTYIHSDTYDKKESPISVGIIAIIVCALVITAAILLILF